MILIVLVIIMIAVRCYISIELIDPETGSAHVLCPILILLFSKYSFCWPRRMILEDLFSKFSEVENNPWCQRVLRSRMQDGLLPKVPIVDDINSFEPDDEDESEGFLAGFPCQVFWPQVVGFHEPVSIIMQFYLVVVCFWKILLFSMSLTDFLVNTGAIH